jgi:hypothetical protein
MPAISWKVFSKNSKKVIQIKNIRITPINTDLFLKSMASAEGVLCNAGFGTASEALFLKKKLLVIPMKGQYEQQCNAASLRELGVPVIKSLKKKHLSKIQDWVIKEQKLNIDYKNETEQIIDYILKIHGSTINNTITPIANQNTSIKKFKQISFGKIISKLSS